MITEAKKRHCVKTLELCLAILTHCTSESPIDYEPKAAQSIESRQPDVRTRIRMPSVQGEQPIQREYSGAR